MNTVIISVLKSYGKIYTPVITQNESLTWTHIEVTLVKKNWFAKSSTSIYPNILYVTWQKWQKVKNLLLQKCNDLGVGRGIFRHVRGWLTFSVWGKIGTGIWKNFDNWDRNENFLLITFFFTIVIYNTSHYFSVLLHLLKWMMILIAGWPHTRKYICTENVTFSLFLL